MRYIVKNIESLLLILLAFILTTSCEDEEISWDVEESPDLLVVEGNFTNELKKHHVILSRTADYFANRSTERVTGAEVAIISDSVNIEFEENPLDPGVYETVRKVSGSLGNTYTLDISLQDPISNKKHYQAREEMIDGIDLKRMEAYIYENPLYVEEAPTDSVMLLTYLYGLEPQNRKNLYMVKLYRNGELLQDTIDEADIYSDREQLDEAYINSLLFFEKFEHGDTVLVEISSVTKAYQEFLEGIKNIANQSGNPFDLSGPPANATGNIERGEALGYFRVSYVSKAQTLVEDRRAE